MAHVVQLRSLGLFKRQHTLWDCIPVNSLGILTMMLQYIMRLQPVAMYLLTPCLTPLPLQHLALPSQCAQLISRSVPMWHWAWPTDNYQARNTSPDRVPPLSNHQGMGHASASHLKAAWSWRCYATAPFLSTQFWIDNETLQVNGQK